MTEMRDYSVLHRTLCDKARQYDLVPMDLRVLVALEERGGSGQTDELESELLCAGSAIRRSVATLRACGYVHGAASRVGVRMMIAITSTGRELVREVRDDLQRTNDVRRPEPVGAVS